MLDDTSAAKGALTTVEVSRVVCDSDSKNYQQIFPDAAETRTMYVVPELAYEVGANLEISNMDWEEYAGDDPDQVLRFDR